MSVKLLDCKNSAPAYTYTPFYLACWANKAIPATLQADIGPVVIPSCPPDTCSCYNFPTTGNVRVQFTRTSDCDWQSGTVVWQCSAFTYPLTLFVNPFGKIYQDNYNIPVIGNVFSFSGDPSPTGSCSYNPATGKTTGTISGVATIPPQGCSCAGCLLTYTLYFDESL